MAACPNNAAGGKKWAKKWYRSCTGALLLSSCFACAILAGDQMREQSMATRLPVGVMIALVLVKEFALLSGQV